MHITIKNYVCTVYVRICVDFTGKTILSKRDMFEEFTQGLIDFYIENSTIENIDTITTRKLLLPHLLSFLQLIETTDDDEFIKVNC